MFSKILIVALLGCSLVLASPTPDNGNSLDAFKPENAVKTGSGLIDLAGKTVENAIGAGKKLVQTGMSGIKKGASEIIEFNKNLIVKTVGDLVKVIEFLNEQLVALGAGKILGPSMKAVENIAHQVESFIKKGLGVNNENPVKDIVDNLGNLANSLPKGQQNTVDNGLTDDIVDDIVNELNGISDLSGKVSGTVIEKLNVPENVDELVAGVYPLENKRLAGNIFGSAADNAKDVIGKASETIQENLNIPDEFNGLIDKGNKIIGKLSEKKGCLSKVVQKVNGAVDKTKDILGKVSEEGSKKLTHAVDVVEAAVDELGKTKNPVSEENQKPTEDKAPKEEKKESFFGNAFGKAKGWLWG